MIKKILISFKNVNHKLLISLLIMGFIPTIYTTIRVFWMGNYPNVWSYSIAGQLSWISLIYEIINEAIILPLFFFVGKVIENKKEFINQIKSGLLVTLCIYCLLSILIIIFAKELLLFMGTDNSILDISIKYIRIEAISNVFNILCQFMIVVLVSLNKQKYVYIITGLKLVLSIIFDLLFVSTLSFSLNLEVIGIGISNIIVNLIIFTISIILLINHGIYIFNKEKMDFGWTKELLKVGGISGLESFVRNIAYMLMIVRMVNIVNEQGTYWMANNFIWGWLLLPINQLGELIKKEIAVDKNTLKNNTLGYFSITFIVIIIWIICIPLYKPFMQSVLNYGEIDKLYNLVIILLCFYVLYAFQNIFDCTFYALGKTNYMLFESIITNTVYYGIAYILYLNGIFKPTLIGIALLFGIGNAFDSIVSFGAYYYLLKKYKYNIFNVQIVNK